MSDVIENDVYFTSMLYENILHIFIEISVRLTYWCQNNCLRFPPVDSFKENTLKSKPDSFGQSKKVIPTCRDIVKVSLRVWKWNLTCFGGTKTEFSQMDGGDVLTRII